jgi:hypothetical protein
MYIDEGTNKLLKINQIKSVDSRRVTWLLFGNIRERLLYMIYHLFERERYLDCIF